MTLATSPVCGPRWRGVYGVFAMATPFEKGTENEIAQGKTLGDVAAAPA